MQTIFTESCNDLYKRDLFDNHDMDILKERICEKFDKVS